MAYIQIPDGNPNPTPPVPQAHALGDLRGWSDPITVPGLGSVSPLTLALIGVLGMFAGVYLYKGMQRAKARSRRARRRARMSVSTITQHQTPTWQTVLLVGAAGAAAYFVTKAVTKQA